MLNRDCSRDPREGHRGCVVLDLRSLANKPGIILYTPRPVSGFDEGKFGGVCVPPPAFFQSAPSLVNFLKC